MWLVFAISAAILWGLNYALTERVLQDIAPTTLLAFEMLLGGICFFIFSSTRHLKHDLATLSSRPSLLMIFIVAIIVVSLANFFIVYSIQAKNATVAGFVELLYPFFTIFFTWILFRENHFNTGVMIGAALLMTGVYIISLSA